jgi:anti-anti-sigma factor
MTPVRVDRLPGRCMTTVPVGPHLTVILEMTSRDAVVAATGEIDAVNARLFADTVTNLSVGCATLLLDLRRVGFLAVDAIAAPHAIRAQMLRADADWAVLPGPAVERVLDLCDPERLVPTAAEAAHRIAV